MKTLLNLLPMIIFPFIGVAIIFTAGKFLWKPEPSKIVADKKYISAKATIGWIYMNHILSIVPIMFGIFFMYNSFNSNSSFDKYFFICLSVLMVAVSAINSRDRYATVAIVEDRLLMCGIIRNITVDMSEIDNITQDFIKVSTPRIHVIFKHKTGFGKRVNFIPINDQIESELQSLLKLNNKASTV